MRAPIKTGVTRLGHGTLYHGTGRSREEAAARAWDRLMQSADTRQRIGYRHEYECPATREWFVELFVYHELAVL
jgi:hypothetical protein